MALMTGQPGKPILYPDSEQEKKERDAATYKVLKAQEARIKAMQDASKDRKRNPVRGPEYRDGKVPQIAITEEPPLIGIPGKKTNNLEEVKIKVPERAAGPTEKLEGSNHRTNNGKEATKKIPVSSKPAKHAKPKETTKEAQETVQTKDVRKGAMNKTSKRKATSHQQPTPQARKKVKPSSPKPSKQPSTTAQVGTRSTFDTTIQQYRCGICASPIESDNHCGNGHLSDYLKLRTKSGVRIREMSEEEALEEEQAGEPYRVEVYDSEEDERHVRDAEGFYTDDDEEGYQYQGYE